MDFRCVKNLCDYKFEEPHQRKVSCPCDDVFTNQDEAVDVRSTEHVENHVEQSDEDVTERRTAHPEEGVYDEDDSCSPKMCVTPRTTVDMMKPDEGETTRTMSDGGVENALSIEKIMEGCRHIESVLHCSSSTATCDAIMNSIMSQDRSGGGLKPRERERARNRESNNYNRDLGGGNKENMEKERWRENQQGCQGSAPLPWSEKKKKGYASTDQQSKEESCEPPKEPERRDINPKPVGGEHVKKKHITGLIFGVDSFTPFGVLKALLLYLFTAGALLTTCSGAPVQEFHCRNHARDENVVVCHCTTVGDGSHIWEFGWPTTCTLDQLFFTRRQSEPKFCNSSGAAISGHGNTTNETFESELAIRIHDVNFHGVVTCSVLRSGRSLEIIGKRTLSGPSVDCPSVSVTDGILTIQLTEDSHRLPSNRVRAMLKHNVTNATKMLPDASSTMQIVASLGDLRLEPGYYSIIIEVSNNIHSYMVHCGTMVFHPGESSTTNPDDHSTSSTMTTVNRSVLPLCLAIGVLFYNLI